MRGSLFVDLFDRAFDHHLCHAMLLLPHVPFIDLRRVAVIQINVRFKVPIVLVDDNQAAQTIHFRCCVLPQIEMHVLKLL